MVMILKVVEVVTIAMVIEKCVLTSSIASRLTMRPTRNNLSILASRPISGALNFREAGGGVPEGILQP